MQSPEGLYSGSAEVGRRRSGDMKVDSHGNFEFSHYPEEFFSGLSLQESVEFAPKRKFDPIEFSLFSN